MEYRKAIELVLNDLKSKGYTRREIEKELNYKENYIDQALSKGGNKKFLGHLKNLNTRLLKKATSEKTEPEEIKTREPLETAIENLSISKVIDSKNIERLITLLELKLSSHTQSLESQQQPEQAGEVGKAANELARTGRTGPFSRPKAGRQ
jgi:hypothetical protein